MTIKLKKREGKMKLITRNIIRTLFILCLPMPAIAALLGPTPYLCFDASVSAGCGTADSPFNDEAFDYFYLENFEDHLFNTLGVTASTGGVTSVVYGPTLHDSVDADDGIIDGSGLDGDSYISINGPTGITFNFDETILGKLPTHAGMVWTDGDGDIIFEAFDSNGVSMGTIGPVPIASPLNNGATDEDRFFGAVNLNGISSIFISNTSGGVEVDHLQYGVVPIPAAVWLFGSGLIGLIGVARRKKT